MSTCFISYAREDKALADILFKRLREAGLDPWMDKPPHPFEMDGLKPGELWDDRLRTEISTAKYFIPLFSSNSVSKTGYVQSEFRQALSRLASLPTGQTFVIPVRIEDCAIPAHRIDGISFGQYNYIDCFDGSFGILIKHLRSEEGNPISDSEFSEHIVSTAAEFLSCVKSNSRVELRSEISLEVNKVPFNEHLKSQEVFDGEEFVFTNIENLQIIATSKGPEFGLRGRPEINIKPSYATVLTFIDCRDIIISGVSLGHWPKLGSCRGAVVRLIRCENVTIDDCLLFGCGTRALELDSCNVISLKDSTAFECSEGIVQSNSSNGVNIIGCEMYDNLYYCGFEIENSEVSFRDCNIANNKPNRDIDLGLFKMHRGALKFENTVVELPLETKLGLDVQDYDGLTIKYVPNP